LLPLAPRKTLALVSVIVADDVALKAVQIAVVPPFVPGHAQYQVPLPIIVDAVPVVQRFVVGAAENVPILLVPQAPLTDVDCVRVNVATILWLAVTLFML
jgi:hypothetical protein